MVRLRGEAAGQTGADSRSGTKIQSERCQASLPSPDQERDSCSRGVQESTQSLEMGVARKKDQQGGGGGVDGEMGNNAQCLSPPPVPGEPQGLTPAILPESPDTVFALQYLMLISCLEQK